MNVLIQKSRMDRFALPFPTERFYRKTDLKDGRKSNHQSHTYKNAHVYAHAHAYPYKQDM